MTRNPLPHAHLGSEIVALYREARAGTSDDFKLAGLTRASQFLPLTSASWVNGVVVNGVPVMHDASSIGLQPGFWDSITSLISRGLDPLGPAMFGAPGHSMVTLPDFYPPEFRAVIHDRYDIYGGLTGLWIDPHTGNFSCVCFYRNRNQPVFTEQERQLHEQLLPHWLESLALYRVLRAARESERVWRPGQSFCVVDRTGLIYHAQPSFGEAVKSQWPSWSGSSLPEPMTRALDNGGLWSDAVLQASWEPTTTAGLMLIELGPRRSPPSVGDRSTELAVSLEQAERQLERLADVFETHQRRSAVVEERQRIVRELHDGVGAHLVGLLSLIQRGPFDGLKVERAIKDALDELRLAVDTMQSGAISVAAALADLRYRLQPRLDAAGIQMEWQVAQELEAVELLAYEVFHLQRVCLEAFTNVLKHAKARRVQVRGAMLDTTAGAVRRIEIEVRDDGIGFGVNGASATGQGIRNMRYRAGKLGAELTMEPVAPSGVALRLRWTPGFSERILS